MEQEELPYVNYIFSAGVLVENELYFFTEKENTLMKANLNNWKMEYVDKFIEHNLNMFGRTESLRAKKRIIYRLPQKGGSIDIFSLDDGFYKNIRMKSYEKNWDNFIAFEVRGRFLYVFPKWEREVIKIDTLSSKLDIFPLKTQNSNQYTDRCFTNFSASYSNDNLLWLFEEGNHQIYTYDLDRDTVITHIVPEEIDRCTSFLKKDELIYCLTPHNKIFVWNLKSNECHQLWEAEKYRNVEYYFGQMIFASDKIIVLPALGDDIVIIDCKNRTSLQYSNYPDDFVYLNFEWAKYINSFEDHKYYYYPMRLSKYLMAVDKKTGEIIWYKTIMPSRDEKKWHLRIKLKLQPNILYENQEKMDIFIDILKENSNEKKDFINLKNTFGNTIWKKVKY